MNVQLLGSGGWIPTSRRETCCAYLRDGDRVLVIDAGTGLQRLLERPELLEGVERFDLVLTHFHLDHVVGLGYLPALPLKPHLWAAGELLEGTPSDMALGGLLSNPYFGAGPRDVSEELHEIPDGEFDVNGFALRTRIQRMHPNPTLALRIGDSVTYCTDTAADPENAGFASGSRLLFHEAWHAADSTDDQTHSAAGEAARIARDAGVERLVLIHVNPLLDRDEELAAPARAVFAESSVGEDLAPLDVV